MEETQYRTESEGETMIYSVIAKSNRVKCNHCGGTIYRGTPKVVWNCGQSTETFHPPCITKYTEAALKYLVEHKSLKEEDLVTVKTKEELIYEEE